jgi:predicted enzyme related to lactoylglutathione lyase
MSNQDRYIPGVPCWIDTTQPDPEAAVEFYGDLFGWQFEDVMPPGSPVKYFVARLEGGDVAAVSSQPEGAPPAAAWNTYIWVADADETAAKVRAAGGSVLSEPMDVGDAGRMGVFADPAGAAFSAWQPNRHRGATVVNVPGSLNFNDLHTNDADGARAFYGAVFGWDLLDSGMWALPAYGDFLEERNPGNRKRMAEYGGPNRFEEVVATRVPLSGDEPAHWGVTFAVEDADAIASRAAERGGTVLLPPTDAPWVRTTTIADPAGAVFTASKFVPENKDLAPTGSATTSA